MGLPTASLTCALLLGALAFGSCGAVHAEDGYELWLRYRTADSPWRERYQAATREFGVGAKWQ